MSYWAADLFVLFAIRDPVVPQWSPAAVAFQLVGIACAPGAGTRMQMFLPLVDPARVRQRPGPRIDDATQTRRGRVLVVEDQPLVAELLRGTLVEQGHEVEVLGSADAARVRIEAGGRYDLVCSDMGLPGIMDGRALAAWLRETRPELPVLLTGGALGASAPDGPPCLPKPFDAAAVRRAVDACLSSSAA